MKNERETDNKTQLIYETDGMCTAFDAVVIQSEDQSDEAFVILDRTAFFPGGGGQECDSGYITTPDGGDIRVTRAAIVDGQVRHYVETPVPAGTAVAGRLDAEKRYARMQNHGSEHLISGIIKRDYGYENVGFHMTDEEVVIDTGGVLTDEQIRQVEERANEAVFKNIPFVISFPTPEQARNTQYRSKIDIYENIRLVSIDGYDVCACCAPHVNSTGQLGVIKITSAMPHRGGMRLTVTAGMDAYHDYVMLHDNNARIMEILSSPRPETAKFLSGYADRMNSLRSEVAQLKKELAGVVTEKVIDSLKTKNADIKTPELIFAPSLDMKGLRDLVNECTKVYGGIICAFSGDDKNGYGYIFAVRGELAKEADIRSFLEGFKTACGAQGGGSDVMVQGTCRASRNDIEGYFRPERNNA